jgi:outer membrane protein TolC
MNCYPIKLSAVLFLVFLRIPGFCQSVEKEGNPDPYTSDWYFLPPVEIFIDSAMIYSPLIKYWQSETEIQGIEIRKTRKSWATRIGIEADARYGTIDNLFVNQSGISVPNEFSTTQTTRYNAGLSLKLPLSELISKQNDNKIARLRYEQSMIKKEEIEQDVRLTVIEQYNKTVLARKILKIAGENKENYFVQVNSAEADYKKGNLDITVYGKINENFLKSEIEYETALEAYQTSLTMLQEITGIEINLMKK